MPDANDVIMEELRALREDVSNLREDLDIHQREVLNREQAAKFLGISPRNLHDLRMAGRIRATKLSKGRYAFRRESLEKYVEENEGFFACGEAKAEATAARMLSESNANGPS